MYYTPVVIEQTTNGERSYDIYSRLLKDRIILLNGEITDEVANTVVAELIFLAAQDSKADISLYINSPGGSVTAGLAIYDTMNYIKPDVSTICVGMAASMGSFLLSSGAKGKRYALPNSEIMIHQPSGGVQGKASDMEIVTKHILDISKKEKNISFIPKKENAEQKKIKSLNIKERLNTILSKNTNQPIEKIRIDTERDNYMFANDALEYGLIDKIL